MLSDSRSFSLSRRKLFAAAGALAGGCLVASSSGLLLRAEDAAASKLLVHSESPFNAEPRPADLADHWITPEPLFYVRNHGNVPQIAAESFRLSVSGMVEKPASFSLKELHDRFPETRSTATLTCAGNRRAEFAAMPKGKTPGVQWQLGAIGNAEWSGVILADVLRHCGLKAGAKHVWFEGLDECKDGDKTFPFGASISLERALQQDGKLPACVLADRMNGEPLTPKHGAPLRGLVPGYIGARSVKWLAKIVVADRPSPNHYVADAYKMIQESTPAALAKAEPIYDFVRNSAITSFSEKGDGTTLLAGYALPQGASAIKAVEVTCDGWDRWEPARVVPPPRAGCWAIWTAALKLPAGAKKLRVRVVDSVGTQPEKAEWNAKGYQYNGWQTYDLPVQKAP